MENTAARERLYRAEAEFDALMEGGRELLDVDGTRYRFADGTEVTGVKAAADHAERMVRHVRLSLADVV